MNFLEAVPAIRRIETNRDALFAIDVVGDVSPADAENLFGLLEAGEALQPRIDVRVRLQTSVGVISSLATTIASNVPASGLEVGDVNHDGLLDFTLDGPISGSVPVFAQSAADHSFSAVDVSLGSAHAPDLEIDLHGRIALTATDFIL